MKEIEIMAGNSVLNKSKLAQDNDEFYTTYDTVEKAVSYTHPPSPRDA